MNPTSKNDSDIHEQNPENTKNIFYSDIRPSQADGLEIENHILMDQMNQNYHLN